MKVLSVLPRQDDPRILVGSSQFDDAGVALLRGTEAPRPDGDLGPGSSASLHPPALPIDLPPDMALVQSVDFFPPVVDDPWWFGRIAAANALSDLYAMGATPFSVLNLVVFNTKDLPLEVLSRILQGGANAVSESGAMMLGGHSVEDEGIKYGLAVTGLVRAGEQTTNAAARPGDVLYLTKRLGTGCLTTAARKGKAADDLLDQACQQMGALNDRAAAAMAAAGVAAATDVTGFGLLGHAHEMAAASGVAIELRAPDLPLLPGARELMARGFASGGAARTLTHLSEELGLDPDLDPVLRNLAADAETSGGLLLAIAEERAEQLEHHLEKRELLVARVGRVLEGQGVRLLS